MTRRLTLVLAVLLLAQWAVAFGHCRVLLAASGGAASGLPGAQICGAHVHEAPSHDEPALDADWDCPACHHVPFLDAAAPLVVDATTVVWALAAVPRAYGAVATLGPRAPPTARAPPPILA